MSRYVKEVNKCLVSIRQGDRSAVLKLHDMTVYHLKGFIWGYLSNKACLDDVILETYQRVTTYINSFDEERDGYNWLCGIAKNVAYTHNKKENRAHETVSTEVEPVAQDWCEALETQLSLASAMKDLNDVDRRILYLRFYNQSTLDEIAKEFGVSKTAIFYRLQRILKTIRKNY